MTDYTRTHDIQHFKQNETFPMIDCIKTHHAFAMKTYGYHGIYK